MLRFNTFCRLWRESEDWWAKEKECRDSEGKRVRSSESARVGDARPSWKESEALRDCVSTALFGEAARLRFGVEGLRGRV